MVQRGEERGVEMRIVRILGTSLQKFCHRGTPPRMEWYGAEDLDRDETTSKVQGDRRALS
jgi:hypothetical protein